MVGGFLSDKYGARPVMLAGAGLAGLGYLFTFFALRGRWAVWCAAASWFVAGFGSGWLYMSAFFLNQRAFPPRHRGYVAGVLSCFLGASATVFVSALNACVGGRVAPRPANASGPGLQWFGPDDANGIAAPVGGGGAAAAAAELDDDDSIATASWICDAGFIGGDVVTYMLFLAAVVPTLGATGAALTRSKPWQPGGEPPLPPGALLRRPIVFNFFLLGTMLLIAFVAVSNYMALDTPRVQVWASYVTLVLLASFALAPLAAPGPDKADLEADGQGHRPGPDRGERERGSRDGADSRLACETPSINVAEPATPGCLAALWADVVGRPAFWALWLLFGATVGVAITTLNTLSSIAASRGEDHSVGAFAVILLTSSDTFSRFVSGFVVGRGAPATTVFTLGPVLGIAGQALLVASGDVNAMYAACVLVGLSDGVMWTLGPLYTGKLFGLPAAGRNFGLVILSAAAWGLALSLYVEPLFFYRHAQGGVDCYGAKCFEGLHFVSIGALVAAFAAACFLHHYARV